MDETVDDEQPPFLKIDGLVQVVMGVWDPGRGLVMTRHGLIYGGHHGKAPMVSEADAEEILVQQVRQQFRALRKRWSDGD